MQRQLWPVTLFICATHTGHMADAAVKTAKGRNKIGNHRFVGQCQSVHFKYEFLSRHTVHSAFSLFVNVTQRVASFSVFRPTAVITMCIATAAATVETRSAYIFWIRPFYGRFHFIFRRWRCRCIQRNCVYARCNGGIFLFFCSSLALFPFKLTLSHLIVLRDVIWNANLLFSYGRDVYVGRGMSCVMLCTSRLNIQYSSLWQSIRWICVLPAKLVLASAMTPPGDFHPTNFRISIFQHFFRIESELNQKHFRRISLSQPTDIVRGNLYQIENQIMTCDDDLCVCEV